MTNFGEDGYDFFIAGAVPEDLLTEIGSPMIPEEVYAAIVNGTNGK